MWERERTMLEKLKKKSIKKSISGIIILLIIGIVLIGIEFSAVISMIKGHVKFETLEPEEIRADLIVDASIDVNFGGFMEEYEENTSTHFKRTTDIYYVIWTGDEDSEDYKYMGIKVPASDESKMEAMAEATYNYEYSDPVKYTGAINKMSSTELKYFKEYFQESGWSDEEIEEYTLPYFINVGALTGGAAATAFFIFVLGVVLAAIGIIMLISALLGGKLKAFKKEIQASGFTEMDVEYEYESARTFGKKDDLRIGGRFIFYMAGNKPHLLVKDQIVWVYQQNTTHRTNGVKTGTTYELLVYCLNDNKVKSISVPNENTGREILQYLNETMPRAVVGFSDELLKMFKKDYQNFLQLRYYRPQDSSQTVSRDSAQPEE